MDDYHKRKERRTREYEANLHLITHPCAACAGSGRYDNNGSPKCGACNGTGKEPYREAPHDRR